MSFTAGPVSCNGKLVEVLLVVTPNALALVATDPFEIRPPEIGILVTCEGYGGEGIGIFDMLGEGDMNILDVLGGAGMDMFGILGRPCGLDG